MLSFFIFNCSKKSLNRGAALVELAIALPVVLLIVLGTVHCGIVLREANIVVEATRHGARSGGAKSGLAPTLSVSGSVGPVACSLTIPPPIASSPFSITNPAILSAYVSSCKYISLSGLTPSEWNITITAGSTASEGGTTPYRLLVTIVANSARGPVNMLGLKSWLNMRPSTTTVFPLEVL